jgi:hypothetical protein
MNVIPDRADLLLPTMDWRDSESYLWITALPRSALAWEFVRRSPDYRATFQSEGQSRENTSSWPLVRLENPDLDARQASPVWRGEVCGEILPVQTSGSARAAVCSVIDTDRLRCRMTAIEERAGITHIVFAERGRLLHLEVEAHPGAGDGLMTPAVAPLEVTAQRTLALRRLSDLAAHGELRPHLYPPESRAPRFARILQALDGALAGVRHRDIAVTLFGERRVAQDWSSPDNHLRDHVRRAVSQGRALMSDGFVRLLG